MTWNAGEKAASNAAFKCLCLAHCFSAACAFNVAVSCELFSLVHSDFFGSQLLGLHRLRRGVSCLPVFTAMPQLLKCGIFCSPSFQNPWRPNIHSLHCTSGAGSHCNSTGRRYSNSKRHRYQKWLLVEDHVPFWGVHWFWRPCPSGNTDLRLEAEMPLCFNKLHRITMLVLMCFCASWPLQLIKSWSKCQVNFASVHWIMT